MGVSSSKGVSNKIEPEVPKSESWSTLDGFVASESGRNRQEVIAVNTIVKDEEIQQVKTFMKFPERKPQSTLNLDAHLNQSLNRKRTRINIHDNFPEESANSPQETGKVLHAERRVG